MIKPVLALLAAGVLLVAFGARAEEAEKSTEPPEALKPPHQQWAFEGVFGTYDRASLQRGFQVYKEVCSACHAVKELYYRDLAALGFSEEEVKALAAQVQVTDAQPNDQGEMVQRPGRPSDPIARPFPNDQAARAANNGALPPDLALITKAREGGADYVFGILNGYAPPPADIKMGEGMNYNLYFPGHQIAMPPPLNEGAVTFADGTPASVKQMAHDVVSFLSWAAEPTLEQRKRTGVKVMIFLLICAGVFYAVKRKIWADLH
jgi:ubiquinol-cytochrome c reductase cytochrome c1 subunit